MSNKNESVKKICKQTSIQTRAKSVLDKLISELTERSATSERVGCDKPETKFTGIMSG